MLRELSCSFTAWKVSKYGVFSGQYFPVFGPEKTPYLETFHAVRDKGLFMLKQLTATIKKYITYNAIKRKLIEGRECCQLYKQANKTVFKLCKWKAKEKCN